MPFVNIFQDMFMFGTWDNLFSLKVETVFENAAENKIKENSYSEKSDVFMFIEYL